MTEDEKKEHMEEGFIALSISRQTILDLVTKDHKNYEQVVKFVEEVSDYNMEKLAGWMGDDSIVEREVKKALIYAMSLQWKIKI